MRTLPLFLLAASPALACGPGSGSLIENLPLLVVFLLLQPMTWLVLLGIVATVVLVSSASKAVLRSQSTQRPR